MRFRFKFDKKGIPAFVLILMMMFQRTPSDAEQTAVQAPNQPLTISFLDVTADETVPFEDGLVLNETTLPDLFNVVAVAEDSAIQAVQFLLDDVELRVDDEPPFTLADEQAGWQLPEAGEHRLTVIPLEQIEEEATVVGEPLTITFSISETDDAVEEARP